MTRAEALEEIALVAREIADPSPWGNDDAAIRRLRIALEELDRSAPASDREAPILSPDRLT